jgi:hypothetical protein
MTKSASNHNKDYQVKTEKDTQASAATRLSRKQKLEAVRKANQALLEALEYKQRNSDQLDAQGDV